MSIAKRRVDVADRLVPGDWEGDGGEIRDAVRAQVRAFREVLPQQSVYVLVRDTLPRALRIAAVHSQSRVNPGLRDNAAAIDALEQATKAGEIWTSIHPLTDRIFDELRGDARFASLLERVGLSGISTQQGPRVTWRH